MSCHRPLRPDPLSPFPNGQTRLTPGEQANACAELCVMYALNAKMVGLSLVKIAEYEARARNHAERCAQLRPLFDSDDEAIAAALERCGFALAAMNRHFVNTNKKVQP
jgi:hypothetical protein